MSAPGCGLGRDRRLALEGHKQVRSRAARAGVRWLPSAISGLIGRGEATGNLRAPLPLATSLLARRSRAPFRQRAPKRLATGFLPCGYGPGCVCAIPAWLLATAASMPYWCQGPQERARTSFALDLARSPTAALAPERLVPIDAAPSRVAS